MYGRKPAIQAVCVVWKMWMLPGWKGPKVRISCLYLFSNDSGKYNKFRKWNTKLLMYCFDKDYWKNLSWSLPESTEWYPLEISVTAMGLKSLWATQKCSPSQIFQNPYNGMQWVWEYYRQNNENMTEVYQKSEPPEDHIRKSKSKGWHMFENMFLRSRNCNKRRFQRLWVGQVCELMMDDVVLCCC